MHLIMRINQRIVKRTSWVTISFCQDFLATWFTVHQKDFGGTRIVAATKKGRYREKESAFKSGLLEIRCLTAIFPPDSDHSNKT
jgi:hypothetical protein